MDPFFLLGLTFAAAIGFSFYKYEWKKNRHVFENQPNFIKLLRYFSIGLATVGILEFFSGILASTGPPYLTSDVEFPISLPTNSFFDPSKNIFVTGSNFYGRVQTYTIDGNFKRGWSVANGGKNFSIEPRGGGRITIDSFMGHRDYDEISGQSLSNTSSDFDSKNSNVFPCTFEGGISTHFICTGDTDSGTSTKHLNRPIHFWFLNGLHGFFFAVFGLLVYNVILYRGETQLKRRIFNPSNR